MTLETLLKETLTSHEYTEGFGAVNVNIADGLFAIAAALNRLADSHERASARTDAIVEAFERMSAAERESEGHA